MLPHITLCDVTISDTYHMALSHIVFVIGWVDCLICYCHSNRLLYSNVWGVGARCRLIVLKFYLLCFTNALIILITGGVFTLTFRLHVNSDCVGLEVCLVKMLENK